MTDGVTIMMRSFLWGAEFGLIIVSRVAFLTKAPEVAIFLAVMAVYLHLKLGDEA
jgi:hypothetical protein